MNKEDKYLKEQKEEKVDVLDRIEIEELINETLEYLEDDELCKEAMNINWGKKSVEKFGKTIGISAEKHGFIDKCILKMKGKKGWDKDKAGGFCAGLVDIAKGSQKWREGSEKK